MQVRRMDGGGSVAISNISEDYREKAILRLYRDLKKVRQAKPGRAQENFPDRRNN